MFLYQVVVVVFPLGQWETSPVGQQHQQNSSLERRGRVEELGGGRGFNVLTFVTQQSSPVDVAHTLPGLGAASVHTSGESHTLITQRALPPVMAPDREQLTSDQPAIISISY